MRALSILVFFAFVMAFTFTSTFVHEMGHALAWGDAPVIEFHDDRESASQAIAHQTPMDIDGRPYQVMEVEQTTIALYPENIFFAGATLGILPASLLPDPVLGSTFYALEDDDYSRLAAGQEVTEWHHSAMPMIVNAILGVPILIWLLKRPSAISMAAAWVNAAEWRFNAHHAAEIGIPSAVYMAISILVMVVVGGLIGYFAVRHIGLPPEHKRASSLSR